MEYYEYLLLTETPSAYFPVDATDPQYRAVVQTGEHDGRAILNITHTENPTLPGDTLVLGVDPATGRMIEPLDSALYQAIRPLGNSPDGTATAYLGYHNWAGAPWRMLGDWEATSEADRLYPADAIPFDAELRHKYFDTPQTPASTGWGFRFELIGGAASRNPSARAIYAYPNDDYTGTGWTTGALQQGPSDWQTDNDGNPLTVWFTESWDGDRRAAKGDWYVGLLYGSFVEGKATLHSNVNSARYLFWDRVQSGGVTTWEDTGATVAAQYGTVYKLSTNASMLSPGQTIRFTESGQETTFTGTQPGYADRILIDPFVQAAVGDAVWVLV